MVHLFVYLIEVSICLALLYLCYISLISGETFYKIKRFYLLLSVVVSIAIPLLPSIHSSIITERKTALYNSQNSDFSNYKDTFEKVVFGNIPVQPDSISTSDQFRIYLIVFLVIYIIGIFLLLCRLANNINKILKLVRSNNIEPYGKYTIVHHNDDYPTFSFMGYIFLNSTNLNNNDMSTVLRHEETHISQGHSFDIFFIEFCKILFWFNPVIWLFKKSLIKVHECQVDDYLIRNREEDILNYQALLLKQYLSNINIELAHPFNYSLIKFRIKMMTKTKSGHWTKYKIVFALPIIIFGLLAFSNANIKLSSQEFTEIVNAAKLWEPEPNGMCYIPAGSFILKRTDGSTTKDFDVTIDPFWMNQVEVNVKQYFVYLESVKKDSVKQFYDNALPNIDKAPYKDYFSNKKYSDFPVVGVSLQQAMNYCKWLTRIENQKLKSKGKPPVYDYRIPSEVEWVYASFGGKNPGDAAIPISLQLTKVSSNKPNGWGLYNMLNNVSEWTYTAFDPGKYLMILQNPPASPVDKIIVRGNNFKNSVINDKLILNGADSYDYVGFRYVRSYLGKKYGLNQ
jgi:beta-lactamase regulating signal transducer with metallopeptidase domain